MADPELKSADSGFPADKKKGDVSAPGEPVTPDVEPSTNSTMGVTSSQSEPVQDDNNLKEEGNDHEVPNIPATIVQPPAPSLNPGPAPSSAASEEEPIAVVTTPTTTTNPEQTPSPLRDAPDTKPEEPPLVVVAAENDTNDPATFNRTKSEEIDIAGDASVASAAPTVVRANSEDPQKVDENPKSIGGATAPPSLENQRKDSDDDVLDEFIKSPHGQNAIVERSPGGRYVRFMEKLGSGASKDVYRAYDTQEGIEVAWNVVSLAGVPKNERNRIVNEVRLLERLHHHNIISFHGSWVNRERQEVHFVTEILSSGTLKSFINKVQVIRWKIAKRWAVQILKGLEYLHSQDPPVIHRDLKCDNIFINGTSGDLRIGDLGLSTVHRNGRVLSVLGTPEFMAPDMYEDTSYDQKVDIYAFGMCMLEIFTKEIPYKECKNPAQIYKKVSNGELPEVLSRLQSRHARDFIMLCLGYKDENGVYIRPTAKELSKHEFLIKRDNDDDEVMVDPPLIKRTITEGETLSPSNTALPANRTQNPPQNLAPGKLQAQPQPQTQEISQPQPQAQTQVQAQGPAAQQAPTQQQREVIKVKEQSPPTTGPITVEPQQPEQGTVDGDESDRFEEMPDSEVHFRKVKVLMGRGQELKEEEEDKDKEAGDTSRKDIEERSIHSQSSSVDRVAETNEQGLKNGIPSLRAGGKPTIHVGPSLQVTQPGHYLVAAAVIENEAAQSYPDDILKLVVTLPVEGQTQNVQFDFHLVEDDPVQVGKEMVAELGIPQGAVLEVSETISGLACAARMQRDKYKIQAQQNSQRQQRQVRGQLHRPQRVLPPQMSGGAQDMQQGMSIQQQSMGQISDYQGQGPRPDYASNQGSHPQPLQQGGQPPEHMQPSHDQGGNGNHIMPDLQSQTLPYGHMQNQGHQQMQGHHQESISSHNPPDSQSQPGFRYDANQRPPHSQMHNQPMGQNGNPLQAESQSLPPYSYEGGHQRMSDTSLQSQQAHPPAYGYDQGQPQQHQQSMQSQHIGQQQGIQDVQNPSGYIYPSQFQQNQGGQSMRQPSHVSQSAANVQHQQGSHLQQHLPQHTQGALQDQQSDQNRFDVQPYYGQSHYPPNPQHHGQQMGHPNQSGMHGNVQPYGHMPQQQPSTDLQPRSMQQHPNGSQPQQQQSHMSQQQQQHQQHPQQQQQPHQQQPQHHQHHYPESPVQHSRSGHSMNTSGDAYHHGKSLPNANSQRADTAETENSSLKRSASANYAPQQSEEATRQSKLDTGVSARAAPDERLPPSRSSSGQISTPLKQNLSALAAQISDEGSVSSELLRAPQLPTTLPSRSSSSVVGEESTGVGSESDDDTERAEELRRLDEDFQKNLQRAKKVFDNRMDNLQRSQVEREAQHQKTLERHQKERAEFEKRLQQEEIEQNRRIEQLQREWDKKREILARNRERAAEEGGTVSAEVSLASSPDEGGSLPAFLPSDNLAAEQFSLNQTESNETVSESGR